MDSKDSKDLVPLADLASSPPAADPLPLADVSPGEMPTVRKDQLVATRTEHYNMDSISDDQIAIEDDEMLSMQIQLGEVPERNLRRRIEATTKTKLVYKPGRTI